MKIIGILLIIRVSDSIISNSMNKFHYISPSIIPSRTANAVHVIMQCDSLANHMDTVVLYSRRSIKNKNEYNSLVKTYYNIKNDIKNDQHVFVLKDPCLGKYNKRQLDFYK